MTSTLEESKESVSNVLFSITERYRICRGRMESLMGLATQLIGFISFTWFIAPHCGKGFLSFFLSPLGFLCMKRKTFKWQTQTPGALQRLKASQDCCCCCSCHHPFHWHDGMKGCMSLLPSPPTSFPWAPLVIQPLPSFIFVQLCELFLNHLSCLCAGFLRRNSTVQWANPFRVCGRRGRKDGHQGKSFKQIAKYWTCVKSCIIYEICIKSNVPSGTINTYSIFEL